MPYADGSKRPIDGDRVKDQDGKFGTVRGVSLDAGGTAGYDQIRVKSDDGTIYIAISNAAQFTLVSREDGNTKATRRNEEVNT